MTMDSPSTPSAGPASNTGLSRLGGIEDLTLKMGPSRRNLFGPVDHQQLQQDFQRLLSVNLEVANKRWNFNFQSDMPGEESTIQWESLRYQDVPVFYHGCTVRSVPRPVGKRRTLSSSSEASPGSSSSSRCGDEYLEVSTREYYRIQRQRKRRQSTITDFFKVKKTKFLHYKGSSRQ
ncbi:cyclin-dependent kinase inhibitor 1D [Pseudochaenichthys georgianus]|uniref:cyclin-dependent kinase inhibitor 1D n=1 Tax=Pseudochaenichthys georgianus TaxID=52239 RepID=UPI00146AC662|nr:cyclin-dependent kinase inhibitor 1D [Pseudochaenichthys georgianus]